MTGGHGSQVAADYVVQFGKVLSSSLGPDTGSSKGVLYSVAGVGETDDTGEIDQSADVFGALGIVARPLPPKVVRGRSSHAEVACLRTADGLIPISTRDLRLRMPGTAPQKGTIALVGYGGGFHSMDAVLDSSEDPIGTIHVVYCPYDYDSNGVAQKAHCITLDPSSGNESISIVHAGGQALLLQDDGSVRMQSADGQSYIEAVDGQVTIGSTQIVLMGNAFIGDPTLALGTPLFPGPASPPCPRLFLSPTI